MGKQLNHNKVVSISVYVVVVFIVVSLLRCIGSPDFNELARGENDKYEVVVLEYPGGFLGHVSSTIKMRSKVFWRPWLSTIWNSEIYVDNAEVEFLSSDIIQVSIERSSSETLPPYLRIFNLDYAQSYEDQYTGMNPNYAESLENDKYSVRVYGPYSSDDMYAPFDKDKDKLKPAGFGISVSRRSDKTIGFGFTIMYFDSVDVSLMEDDILMIDILWKGEGTDTIYCDMRMSVNPSESLYMSYEDIIKDRGKLEYHEKDR